MNAFARGDLIVLYLLIEIPNITKSSTCKLPKPNFLILMGNRLRQVLIRNRLAGSSNLPVGSNEVKHLQF